MRFSWGQAGLGLACLAGLSACEGPPAARPPPRPLAAYEGRSAHLFDDQIEAAAVGLALTEAGEPRFETEFRERTNSADAVLRVRVDTVNVRNHEGPSTTYQLGVRTLDRLGGKSPPPDPFFLEVGRDSHGLAKNFEGQLVGKTFIVFVRSFVRPDGDSELHFHFAPDNKTVEAAVREAVILDEVK
jgi:hypothetical protein